MTDLTEAEIERLVWEFGDHTNIYTLADTVAALIDARLAPIRALAEEWASEPSTAWWGEGVRAAVDAASAASAPVSAQQDHDGTEGQGAEIEAARGKELLCERCGCTRWSCLTKFDGKCCGTCDHPTTEPEENR